MFCSPKIPIHQLYSNLSSLKTDPCHFAVEKSEINLSLKAAPQRKCSLCKVKQEMPEDTELTGALPGYFFTDLVLYCSILFGVLCFRIFHKHNMFMLLRNIKRSRIRTHKVGEQIATKMCIQLTCTLGYLYATVFIKVCVDCADTHILYWYNLDISNTWHIFLHIGTIH